MEGSKKLVETAVPLGLNLYFKRLTHCTFRSTVTRTRDVEWNDRQLVTPREVVLCHNIYIAIFIAHAVERILLTGKPLSCAS